ncbi:hypothetical protein KSP39_PZI023142 [Platanthera zijinensis]|uniref:Uncharacterized protein n=1 Tax=Platanthera zijinensis TaxID=2320716 RepID=A0AAP0AUW5_9ASPA
MESDAQKYKIEMLMGDILATGTICASPFSSLVLLVRKKDDNCRFCIDYRELIKVTIPDKFPIQSYRSY